MGWLRAGLVLSIIVGATAFVASPASAHDVSASGVVGCTTTGEFEITWTIFNDTNSEMTAAVSSTAGGLAASQVIVEAVTGVGLTSNTVTQTVAASETGSTVTLNVSATWADGFVDDPISASVVLDPPCEQPTPPTDPTSPTTQPRRQNRSSNNTSNPAPVQVGGITAARAIVAGANFTG